MSLYLPTRNRPLWSQQQLALLAGFAVVALFAWWQLQKSADLEQRPARPRLPDYVVQDFTAVETDANGKPSRKLVADELRHFVDEKVSELDKPRMTIFQADGPPWQADARRGLVLASGDEVQLIGNVQIDRSGSGGIRPAHMETERLDIWRKRSLAETDLPVRILSDGDTLTAKGMQLWYSEPSRTTFHGRAHIRLAPEQEKPSEQPQTQTP